MFFGVISNYLLHLFTCKALEKCKKEFNMLQIIRVQAFLSTEN